MKFIRQPLLIRGELLTEKDGHAINNNSTHTDLDASITYYCTTNLKQDKILISTDTTHFTPIPYAKGTVRFHDNPQENTKNGSYLTNTALLET